MTNLYLNLQHCQPNTSKHACLVRLVGGGGIKLGTIRHSCAAAFPQTGTFSLAFVPNLMSQAPEDL